MIRIWAALLLMALLGSGCQQVVGHKVLVIGDGAMSDAIGTIEVEMALSADGHLVAANALPQFGLADTDDYWVDRITELATAIDGVDYVVVHLGAEDALSGTMPSDLGTRIDRVVAASAPATVLWITLNEDLPGAGVADSDFNDALRDAALTHEDLRVVDFGAESAANPDYLTGDGVHWTVAGQRALAARLLVEVSSP